MYGRPVWIMRASPSAWKLHVSYLTSSTFIVPQSGWYRVFCIGKSGDGGAGYQNNAGLGGGGSGGVAVSTLLLSSGTAVSAIIEGGVASFQDAISNPGSDGNGQSGGNGGSARGGNVYNFQGFRGGNGGPPTSNSRNGWIGEDGPNGGMAGGYGGRSMNETQIPGSGGGGGARLPGGEICPYISPTYTSQYRAAQGGYGAGYTNVGQDSASYPPPILNQNLMLFGGGGGAGGHGYFNTSYPGKASLGSPAAIIIEIPL